jgi:diguanylate cyclase (GGDEF)-like protein
MRMAEALLAAPRSASPSFTAFRRTVAAAEMPRFRAATRGRLRRSTQHAMGVVILAAVVDACWLLPDHPSEVLRVAGVNLAASAIALAAYILLHRRHAPVEAILFGVLVAVDGSIALVVGIDLEVSLTGAGYVLLLPPIVALLIPWGTRVHIAWLIGHAIAAAILSMLATPEWRAIGGPRTLMALLVVASTVSLLGHLANLRARVVSFGQIEQIRSMNRHARRDDVRLRRLNSLLQTVARTDELTGLGNRVGLERHLRAMRSRIDRRGDQFVLLMLDLDRFKAINDSLGHNAGDDVLRRIAHAIEGAMRAGDAVYRFGGEEFIAIVALDAQAEAAIVAERVRSEIEALAISHPANPPFGKVTVSIGGCVVDRSRLGEDDDAWLRRADEALYAAKGLGRNRSVIG